MSALIWITGLAGSGKSTLARGVYDELKKKYSNVVLLDGDHFREIMGHDVQHSGEGRLINAWRIARMCKFLAEQDIYVVCATISLYREVQEFNREHIERYFEIYIDVKMEELVKRDQKGLYSKALRNEIQNVVGVDQPFHAPSNPELRIQNNRPEEININIEKILKLLQEI